MHAGDGRRASRLQCSTPPWRKSCVQRASYPELSGPGQRVAIACLKWSICELAMLLCMQLFAVILWYMMLHVLPCCYIALHDVTWCYMLLHVVACCCMLLHVVACCCMLLHVASTWCYMMLLHYVHDVACRSANCAQLCIFIQDDGTCFDDHTTVRAGAPRAGIGRGLRSKCRWWMVIVIAFGC